MANNEAFIGVDVGTSGVRSIVVSADGRILGESSRSWPLVRDAGGVHEQDPQTWWVEVMRGLGNALHWLTEAERGSVTAICVVSTSGTIVLTDRYGNPVRPAIMWDDTRAGEQATALEPHNDSLVASTGIRVRPSSPIAKLEWVREREPQTMARVASVLTAADWLAGQLGAEPPVSDATNVAKFGFSARDWAWAACLDEMWFRDRLPEVVAPMAGIGSIAPSVAEALGLSSRVRIVAGMTDANTATIAAGVIYPGQWASTIGTGLSIKSITRDYTADPTGEIYSHITPRSHWAVSGTSHCGAAGISTGFAGDLDELAGRAQAADAGVLLVYPLPRTGEFFPFWAPHATAFTVGTGSTEEAYRSTLEGIAVVELLCMRRIESLGVARPQELIALGGTSEVPLFSRIRASLLNVPISTPARPDSCMGAALLAMGGGGLDLADSVGRIVAYRERIDPDPSLASIYRELTGRYIDEFVRRGFIQSEQRREEVPIHESQPVQ